MNSWITCKKYGKVCWLFNSPFTAQLETAAVFLLLKRVEKNEGNKKNMCSNKNIAMKSFDIDDNFIFLYTHTEHWKLWSKMSYWHRKKSQVRWWHCKFHLKVSKYQTRQEVREIRVVIRSQFDFLMSGLKCSFVESNEKQMMSSLRRATEKQCEKNSQRRSPENIIIDVR